MAESTEAHRLLQKDDCEVFLIRIPEVDRVEEIEWEPSQDGNYEGVLNDEAFCLVERKAPESLAVVWGDGETTRTRWITTQWTVQKKVSPMSVAQLPLLKTSYPEQLDNLQVKNWTLAQNEK